MTSSKKTKSALLASVFSLVLCAAMLIGGTLAWFTDRVVSGNNRIVAGSLDVELYHGEKLDEKVDGSTTLFAGKEGESIQWEPGVIAYENFRVANAGSLALKYELSMRLGDYNTVEGSGESLKDVLQVAVVEGGFDGTREDVSELAFESLNSFIKTGNLLAQEDDTYGVVIYWEPGAADNAYNLNNSKKSSDGKALFVDLGINLKATQDTVENDGFGDQYDADATWIEPWDGESKEEPEQAAGVYQISTAAELAWALDPANIANNTFALLNDVDLGGKQWPVASNNGNFTFDGQGHTIRNFTMDAAGSQSGTGLFGSKGIRGAVIQNVVIEDAVAVGAEYTGVVLGMSYGCTLDNITLRNITVTSSLKWAGGVVGYAAENTNLTNITVEDASIKLEGTNFLEMSKVGAVAGAWQTTTGATATAENITVRNTSVTGGLKGRGIIIGTYDGRGVATMSNCHAEDCTGSNYLIGEIYWSNYPVDITLRVQNCSGTSSAVSGSAHWETIA